MRVELQNMRDKLKVLGLRVSQTNVSQNNLDSSQQHYLSSAYHPAQKRSKSSLNLLQQENDLDECIIDEGEQSVPNLGRSNLKDEEELVFEDQKKQQAEITEIKDLPKRGSESPMIPSSAAHKGVSGAGGSEIKKSFKDVASYLTPNKSSSKSMNHTSQ